MTRAWPIFDTAFKEEKWLQMVVLSLFLHLGIFSTIFLFPVATIRMPSIEDRVYHVELVGFPSFSHKSDGQDNSGRVNEATTKQGKGVYVSKAKAQRITVKKKKPVRIVAKRVSSKPVNADKKKESGKSTGHKTFPFFAQDLPLFALSAAGHILCPHRTAVFFLSIQQQ